ncbi:MAG: biotin/lipoyl-containing protein [Bacteroidales bacterium]|nr:biotin/lipoyl-containing protein [Bacteroidales bacterium]MDZ4204631.1 biotin/lipoyl-containing protein [Bacteroidales bacterium]
MKENEPVPPLSSFNVDGAKYKTHLSRKYNQRKPYIAANPKKIIAFIPGTIRQIFVKVGDEVKMGDKLLTLEAMKMNNNVVSLVDGVVKALHVNTGEVVSNKQLLVELE